MPRGVSQQCCPESGEKLGHLVGFAQKGWLRSRALSYPPLRPDHSLWPALQGSSDFGKGGGLFSPFAKLLGALDQVTKVLPNPGLHSSPSYNHRQVTNPAHPSRVPQAS